MMVGNTQKEVKLKEYRYTGKERDNFTGLYYYGARYYASWLGRWLTCDPIVRIYFYANQKISLNEKKVNEEIFNVSYNGKYNLYTFVSDNPINKTDIFGLDDEDIKKGENWTKNKNGTYLAGEGATFWGLDRVLHGGKNLSSRVEELQKLNDVDVPKEGESYQIPESWVEKKKIALTFDDGPDPKKTLLVLKLLREYNMKATFFVLGSNVEKYPNLIKQMIAEGHQVEIHGYEHTTGTYRNSKSKKEDKYFDEYTQTQVEAEISKTIEAIKGVLGDDYVPSEYRPFGLHRNEKIEAAAKKFNLFPLSMSNLDSWDTQSYSNSERLKHIKDNLESGSIILFHDIKDDTVKEGGLLEETLKYLAANNFNSVTLKNLRKK